MKAYRHCDRDINHQTKKKSACHTFRQLLDKRNSHLIRVTCNNKVNIQMEKMIPANNFGAKRNGGLVKIAVGSNGSTLKEIFQTYLACDDNEEYVLVHKASQLTKQKYPSRSKSHSNKSQTSIRPYSSNKLITQQWANGLPQPAVMIGQRKKLNSVFSQKLLKNELKDYLSQDDKRQQQIKMNPNCIFLKKQQKAKIFNDKPNVQQGKTTCLIKNMNLISGSSDKKPKQEQKMLQRTHEKQQSKLLNPKFSFGQIMKMGLIQQQSFKCKQSFQIAGDEEIQRLKLPETTSCPNNLRSFQDLSSIISNVKDDTKKEMDLDSIKNDIEKINKCCVPLDKQFYKRLSNQKGNNQNVMSNNKDEKEIAPLKFRKKEEVVKHLVNAKIIFKQSNSINIF